MIYNVLRWYHEDLNIPTPVACNMYFLGNKYYRGGESTYFARMKFHKTGRMHTKFIESLAV